MSPRGVVGGPEGGLARVRCGDEDSQSPLSQPPLSAVSLFRRNAASHPDVVLEAEAGDSPHSPYVASPCSKLSHVPGSWEGGMSQEPVSKLIA